MKYVVRVGDEEIDVLLDGESVTVDGSTMPARLADTPSSPMHVVTVGREVYRVLARRGAQKGRYDLWVAGHRFAVEALDERTRAIRALAGRGVGVSAPAHLVAPMPGLIVRVNVSVGDQVRAGEGLVVIEAMKMENELRAPADGMVRRVAVTPGTAVERGTVLVEMEADAS